MDGFPLPPLLLASLSAIRVSLPGNLQIRPDRPLIEPPYIKVSKQQPIVGIHWLGRLKLPPFDKAEDWRLLPLESFAPIVERTTISLLSLQKGAYILNYSGQVGGGLL